MLAAVKAMQVLMICALFAVALGSTVFVVGSQQQWWKADVVLTGSMEPTMPVGSLVFAAEVPTENLAVGDVLMFNAPMDGSPRVMHRIVDVKKGEPGAVLAVHTKGDNNPARDFWLAQIHQPTSLVVDHHVPYLGFVVNKPILVALVLAGLVLLLFGLGFVQSALEQENTGGLTEADETPHPEPLAAV